MSKLRNMARAVRRLAGLVLPLAMLGGGGVSSSEAKDAGAAGNVGQRDNDRYSLDYYRRRGDYGRPGDRMSADDPRGHMSHGHGLGHR